MRQSQELTMPMRGIAVAKDVEHWLSRLGPAQRAALEKLRAQIRKAAPDAEEVISYGQPTFKLHGHLVAFGAFKNHLSFFPMSSSLIQKFPEAAPFTTSSGTMQFQPDKPIPAALIAKLVKARIAQNLEIADERAHRAEAKKAARKPKAKK
jgi:uncharacterized protein YdhG (YjbR/CyaY superfamily)